MRRRGEWIRLGLDQDGACARTRAMDFDTGWDERQIVYRMFGGSDARGNRVLLHPNCRFQVPSLNLKVTKPVPE